MEEGKEIWKDISGYPGYKVSNLGRVKSIERKVKLKNGSIRTIRERILKPKKTRSGYLEVCLIKGEKKISMLIHRLVGYAFVQNDSIFNSEINHIDENKENNCASNLEWCTKSYNINFGSRNKRAGIAISKANTGVYNTKTSKAVKCIETGQIYPSLADVHRQLGFSHSSICLCCKGKRNSCGGYHWRYVD